MFEFLLCLVRPLLVKVVTLTAALSLHIIEAYWYIVELMKIVFIRAFVRAKRTKEERMTMGNDHRNSKSDSHFITGSIHVNFEVWRTAKWLIVVSLGKGGVHA